MIRVIFIKFSLPFIQKYYIISSVGEFTDFLK